ncbi:MAG TPA: hypothetical protein VGX02_06915, partial [Candidatus Eremiobacteraceae bacterium]|nr:hypothetical protein [Candidatus Eremiobacteraceae bacterium]
STNPTPPPQPSFVYYSTFSNTVGAPGLGVVPYPLTNTSTLTLTINNSAINGLVEPSALLVDGSGRLFVLNDTAPYTIPVYALPLTATSTPAFTLTMPAGTNNAFNMNFDASGNLWVSSTNSNTIYEFTGPFNASATLVPVATIATGVCGRPEGLGFDVAGNLYAACESSTGAANAVGVFLKGTGFTNATALDHVLIGPGHPEALNFDRTGNLYVGSNLTPPNAGIAQYLSNNLAAAAAPNVYNSTGMSPGPFPEQFVFDPAGNLYDADCGTNPHIYVYPTGSQAFSATLAPTAAYSDANIVASNCVGGIALH